MEVSYRKFLHDILVSFEVKIIPAYRQVVEFPNVSENISWSTLDLANCKISRISSSRTQKKTKWTEFQEYPLIPHLPCCGSTSLGSFSCRFLSRAWILLRLLNLVTPKRRGKYILAWPKRNRQCGVLNCDFSFGVVPLSISVSELCL